MCCSLLVHIFKRTNIQIQVIFNSLDYCVHENVSQMFSKKKKKKRSHCRSKVFSCICHHDLMWESFTTYYSTLVPGWKGLWPLETCRSVLRCTYTLKCRTLSLHLELDCCSESEKFMNTESQGGGREVVDDRETCREGKERSNIFVRWPLTF